MATISSFTNIRPKLKDAFDRRAARAIRAGGRATIRAHKELVKSWSRQPVFTIDTEESEVIPGLNGWAQVSLSVVVDDITFDGASETRWHNMNYGVETAPNGINQRDAGKTYPMKFRPTYSPHIRADLSKGTGRSSGAAVVAFNIKPGRKIEARDMINGVYEENKADIKSEMISGWGT